MPKSVPIRLDKEFMKKEKLTMYQGEKIKNVMVNTSIALITLYLSLKNSLLKKVLIPVIVNGKIIKIMLSNLINSMMAKDTAKKTENLLSLKLSALRRKYTVGARKHIIWNSVKPNLLYAKTDGNETNINAENKPMRLPKKCLPIPYIPIIPKAKYKEFTISSISEERPNIL